VNDYPAPITPVGHVEPVPRRVRATLGGETVLDTTAARYVWETSYFPQYYVPLADVRAELLVKERAAQPSPVGTVERHGLRVGDEERAHAARVVIDSPLDGVAGTVRFEWSALDAWFEEDERVFVHPRNPYSRVDAVRSRRSVRVEIGGVGVAESDAPVMVFETGLPTRYYLDRTAIDFTHLVPSDTVTACPYKGTTSGYWSAQIGADEHTDIAWTYDFPTLQVQQIAGLVAFYNEKVDLFIDGTAIERPQTRFS
jgi:uncharacterized protein (DUF427 family)